MSRGSGRTDKFAAPYSRAFTNPGGTVDLTTQVAQCKGCASSGMIVIATGATTFTYKDCSGTSVAIALDDNAILYLDGIAATTLEASATCIVLVYWHTP